MNVQIHMDQIKQFTWKNIGSREGGKLVKKLVLQMFKLNIWNILIYSSILPK